VMTIDLVPTLLAALDVPPPPGLQGENLMPWIRGESDGPDPERMRVSQTKTAFAVSFGDRWKVMARIENDELKRQGLYDLQDDPEETRNLYDTPEGRATFNRLMKRFLDWRAETHADDERFKATVLQTSDPEADLQLLQALGYVGEDGKADDGADEGDASKKGAVDDHYGYEVDEEDGAE